MQNEDKASRVEDDPMPNAKRSVTDVIVMATPACFIVQPNRSLMSLVWQVVLNYTANNQIHVCRICGHLLSLNIWTDVVHALDDDKHVVDSDAK